LTKKAETNKSRWVSIYVTQTEDYEKVVKTAVEKYGGIDVF
jgi:hypothetical protein